MEFCLFSKHWKQQGDHGEPGPTHLALSPGASSSRVCGCLQGTEQLQPRHPAEAGLRNYTEAKSRASCQEEQGSSQEG